MLKLNQDKSELILIGSKHNLSTLPSFTIEVGDSLIDSSRTVKNVGASFDQEMSMQPFVDSKVKSALFYLRNIKWIRRYLTQVAAKLLIHAYVISRLDFSNSII